MSSIDLNKRYEILIVDDVRENLELLSNFLSENNYQVRAATNGEVALMSIEAKKPDLIILDVNMPGINGFEVCRRLKREKSTHSIPIIFISGNDNVNDKVSAFKEGGVDYITKPFANEEVLARVSMHLQFHEYQKTLENKLEDGLKEKYELLEKHSQKLQEQMLLAQEANKAKSEFLANVSHEIRTPLNAIMGFVSMLKKKEDDENKLKYLNIVDDSSKHLLCVIDDILDFGKLESGKLDIDFKDFEITKELSSIKELYREKCKEKNITLHINEYDLPRYLNGDIFRIRQIISNILSNSVKFTPENKNIYLDICFKDESLHVKVRDEGIGIKDECQNKIFEAFSQEDGSTTRKYGGLGLGLSIVHNLLKAMGGELTLKSEVDVGSEFCCYIPLKETEDILTENTNNDLCTLSGHILVVEDNKATQLFMKLLLEDIGLKCSMAYDGLEAIKEFSTNKYDAILMDENMPNMNGMEATKRILEIESQNNIPHTPIIALTANSMRGDREIFLSAGMDEYLSKPLDKSKLVKILSNIIQER